jgi:hypothetical protein
MADEPLMSDDPTQGYFRKHGKWVRGTTRQAIREALGHDLQLADVDAVPPDARPRLVSPWSCGSVVRVIDTGRRKRPRVAGSLAKGYRVFGR